MERKLHITATSKMNLPVDQIEFNISLKTIKEEYNEAYQEAKKQLNFLQNSLMNVGIKNDDIKTNSFYVNKHYENYRDEKNIYQNKFTGYEVQHQLSVCCDYNTDMLEKIINSLSECEANPEFNIRFTVKNPEKAKKELLKKITSDAHMKAKLLAKENKVKLVSIVDIDYSYNNQNFYSPTTYECAVNAKCLSSDGMNITAADVQIEGQANFVWEIE